MESNVSELREMLKPGVITGDDVQKLFAHAKAHGFALPAYNYNLSLEPGESTTIEFEADADGVFTYYCSEFCSALHLEMMGYLLVEPN